ncbi:MAG: SGNH/GDSL hydrolase family protein [Isosphaeraceae bacterium]
MIALLCMLALGAIAPREGRFSWLRGARELHRELESTGAAGYYEGLLNAGIARSPGREVEPPRPARPEGWVAFVDSGIIAFEPGYRRWRMKAGVDTFWNGNPFRTNRLGFRSPEISIEKPPGTYRVVVLGSSNTMGHGVDDDSVYVRLLERWLNEEVGPEGPRVEVVNLASSGESPSQRLSRLKEDVERLDPDWILCDASVIDVSLEELHLDQMIRTRVEIPLPYVRRAIAKARVSSDDTSPVIQSRLRTVAEDLLRGAYEGWGEESRRLGTPVAVILLPRADQKARNPTLRRLMLDLSERNGLRIYDLLDAFETLTPEEFRVAPWDNHPSVLGHRVIFEALRAAILRDGGCPGLRFSTRRLSIEKNAST